MTPEVNITFEATKALTGLSQTERRLETLRPLWDKFDDEFYAQETKHFASANFASLSPAYAKRKARLFGQKPILRASDVLFESVTQQGKTGGVRRPSNLTLEIGTQEKTWHQFGGGNLPARPIIAEPDVDAYQTLAGEYLSELIATAGFN